MTTHEIKLSIHDESELYSSYDPDQKLLSEDICAYLGRCYLNLHKSKKDQYLIRILCDAPADEERIKKSIQDHYANEKNNIRSLLKRYTLKEICLGALGLILIAVWFFLSGDANSINLEILSILGWVCVWEAASIAFMELPEINRRKKVIEHAIHAEIIVDSNLKG